MLPMILIGTGAIWLWHRHKTHSRPRQSARPSPHVLHAHDQIMARVFDPGKLEQLAREASRNSLHHQAHELRGKAAQIRKQYQIAGDLVERARSNDQNAMGMIAEIGKNAAAGDPRACVSANAIAKYCEQRPPRELGPLGETPMGDAA